MSTASAEFWAQLPLGRNVRLLTRDDQGVAALAKPAGALSHPNTPKDQPRALLTCAYDEKRECFVWPAAGGVESRLWLLNRLDSATSGVILVAAGEGLAAAIKAQFARRQVHKVYEALVFGKPRLPDEIWRDRLTIEKRGGAIRTGAAGNIPAESHFSLLRTRAGQPPLALVRLEPKTGRSHQLRVQCARRRLPIVGDQTYGDFRLNREFVRATGFKRLFLHSMETRFEYEWAGRKAGFSAAAPLPEEFTAVLG